MKAGPGITEEIADFVVVLRTGDLSPEIQHIAKRCIIDGIGVILAGSNEPCTRIVLDHVRSLKGRKESSVLGKGRIRAPAHLAALVNGIAGHSMDWDDSALPRTPDRAVLLHPTLAPLASGLSIGEKLRVSGNEFLGAFVIGFEVECKIAEAIYPDHWIRGFHSSNTVGVFGATVAASKLMGLDTKQVLNAIGIAASTASGLTVNFGTMAKPFHAGRAAENGILSAQLAARGFESHPEALEAHKGYFHAFGGGFDPKMITGKLGRPFSILDPGASIKPYPCGVVGHPGMDAMRTLVTEYDVRPEQVDHVKVATGSNVLPPRGPLRYRKAQTALQGKFCVPFQMASMIVRRNAGIMEFTDEFVQSPVVQEMMDRIEPVIDPEIDALGMDKLIFVIEMSLKDGRVLRGRSLEHYHGGPKNPFTREELAGKFNDCVQQVLNSSQGQKLFETIEALERLKSVSTLTRLAAPL